MKRIYLVRHSQAAGQEPEAPLTETGAQHALELAEFLQDRQVGYIVSSPFVRAMETIKPLSDRIQVEVRTDGRLQERVLSAVPLADWMEKLEATYQDDLLKYEGGESAKEAAERGLQVIGELRQRPESSLVAVTHGALLSLILRHYDGRFGFENWRRLTNPDVYELTLEGTEGTVKRIWESG
ncbi:histidine phosphatase family protein [Paenibacillus aurantius]|uniref:Histidine phosphatase family protein n=1 Tax=Paenibacillus aurantius TaxID=2918900 RepID=A0AA96LF91_9BACL|nr:histidine phosphatase family protein [Paenibacillus aurantius]WNQ11958.1 histidine phosphatase family protein [Paenibacillus aurantius]